MKKYYFASNLLVPAAEVAGKDFRWIDTFTTDSESRYETVNVIAFNTATKDDIKPILEKELLRLQKIEKPSELDTNNMAYIETLLRELEGEYYEHDAPADLLKAVSKSLHKTLDARDVIYLSGLTRISE